MYYVFSAINLPYMLVALSTFITRLMYRIEHQLKQLRRVCYHNVRQTVFRVSWNTCMLCRNIHFMCMYM